MSYIGIDVGTSGCKAAVLQKNGAITACASREYPFIIPNPGWAELDPAAIWQAVKETLRELAPHTGEVTALAVSSIGESMVLLDEDDNILYNAIVYVDSRCEGTVAEVAATLPPRKLHAITGMPLNQMYTLNKLLWLRANCPEVLEKANKALLFVEYIGYMLTGNRLVDPASASRTMLMDTRTLDWSDSILAAFGIEKGLFAPVAPSGTKVGTLLPALAKELGLPTSATLVLGSHDQPCSTLGSGTLNAGDALITQGSTESINLVIERDNITEALLDNKIGIEPFFGGRYYVNSAQLTHGTTLRWFVQNFKAEIAAEAKPGESLYAACDRLCAKDSGRLYFLPYMSGVDPNDADNDAKGCFIGLDVTVDMWQMYRAVLEGLSFETRMRLERLVEGGVPLGTITAAGGAAKSQFFMQMKADVLERPLRILQNEEAGITGLGMICAVAEGKYASYAEAAKHFVQTRHTLTPKTAYTPRYEDYRTVHKHIRSLYRELR